MNYGEGFIKELLQGADPKKLAAMLKDIKPSVKREPKDPAKSNGPVKVYTTVTKQYKCIACDNTFSVVYQMEKGETISTIHQDGSVATIIISGSKETLTIKSFCSVCDHCEAQAIRWTKEELVQRWMALIRATSFKEKLEYQQAMCRKEIKI